jgi:hypothetical protein
MNISAAMLIGRTSASEDAMRRAALDNRCFIEKSSDDQGTL